MTQAQYLTIIGTIYITHSMNKELSGIVGLLVLLGAAANGLGWL